MTETPTNKSAWVQLYEARRPSNTIKTRSPGRPPSPVPRHKVGITLSQGETSELEAWQQRFSKVLGRKVSLGETIGILTRISTARLNNISPSPTGGLDELVEALIGQAP
jgi:hypothetical protein